MISRSFVILAALACVAVPGVARPQSTGAARPSTPALTGVKVQGVAYGSRPGLTNIQFKGTTLMPNASGVGRVEKQGGNNKVTATFTGLQNPAAFGHEYLTYVLWALTPDGRAFNMGEVVLPEDRDAWTSQGPGNRSELTVTTPVQTFAMVISAEPYYAAKTPSRVVVLQNSFPAGAVPLQAVDVTFDLTAHRGYEPTGFRFDQVLLRSNLPLDFFQARNAVRIAQAAGAEEHAATVYANATAQMRRAEELAGQRRVDKRALKAVSREAVQTAEDARDIAARGTEARRLETERRLAAEREAALRAQAQAELDRKLKAEAEARAQAQADLERRLKAEADRAAQAEAERLASERRRDEADRVSREALAKAQEALRAQAEAEERQVAAQRAQAEAEAKRVAAMQQQQQAEAEAARNRAAAAELDRKLQQAIAEREDLRASLLQQLNVILETRDTARGLVVNLSDVTFASGQATLQPGAREKLARVSGILAAHPTLKLEIEGHTDSVGSDELNQALSERRAQAVRAYLIQQGVPGATTSAAGFGEGRPVAGNDTSEGRQLNRRVELVVSGDAIGTGRP